MSALSRFEGFLQELMDGRVVRLMGGTLHPSELAQRILQCMEANQTAHNGGVLVPNSFTVTLNGDDYFDIRAADAAIELKLADYAVEAARERGFNFVGSPRVTIRGSATPRRGQIEVEGHSEAQPVARKLESSSRLMASGIAPLPGADEPAAEARRSPKMWPGNEGAESRRSEQPVQERSLAKQRSRRHMADAGLLPTAWLEVAGLSARTPLDHVPYEIGRQEGNDLVAPSASVSRRHLRIDFRDGEFELEDLGSRNGTLLNGRAVSRASLRDGDRVSIGGLELLFRMASGE